jgi:hypothetical protein
MSSSSPHCKIAAEQDFGVAICREPVTEPDELSAQFHEIVDLAGIDEACRRASLVFRAHRLHAAGEIDDGETAVPEADMPIDPDPAGIRTAVRHRSRHLRDDVLMHGKIAVVADPAGNSTHGMTLSAFRETPHVGAERRRSLPI